MELARVQSARDAILQREEALSRQVEDLQKENAQFATIIQSRLGRVARWWKDFRHSRK